MSLASGNVPVQYMMLDGGFRGTDQTVALMQRISMGQYGARSTKIRALAINILRRAGVPEKDYGAEVVAIHNWVRDQIRYTRDVHGQETLSYPEETAFNSKAGDCDDKTMLEVALLSSVGIPTRIKVIGVTPERYSHVYLQARVGNRWVSLDPIMRQHPAGWEAPAAFRKIEKVYPENIPEGTPMSRGVNGLGYVGDPRIVSHLEADPAPHRSPAGPYVRMNSFLDNDAPIEQLSNNAPAFPQNQNVLPYQPPVARSMRPQFIDMRQRNAAVAAQQQREETAYDEAEDAAWTPGFGMGDVMHPEALSAMGAPVLDYQAEPNMQRPALVASPDGIDTQFGRNGLVMNAKRGDRIAYRGLQALSEQPPITRVPVGVAGLAPVSRTRQMMPGMGYLSSRSLSGPGMSELAEAAVSTVPEAPAVLATAGNSTLKTLGLLAIAAGISLYLTRK